MKSIGSGIGKYKKLRKVWKVNLIQVFSIPPSIYDPKKSKNGSFFLEHTLYELINSEVHLIWGR